MAASMRRRFGATHCSNWVRSDPDTLRAAIRIAQRRDRAFSTKIEADSFCLLTVGHGLGSCPVHSSLVWADEGLCKAPGKGQAWLAWPAGYWGRCCVWLGGGGRSLVHAGEGIARSAEQQ